MKLLSPEQVKEHDAVTLRGAIEGTIASSIVAGAGSYYLYRRWPRYRTYPLSIKLLGAVLIIAPALAVQAERRGLEYDRSQWTGAGMMELERVAAEEQTNWEKLDFKQRMSNWAVRHQWPLLIGGWATSLAAAGIVLSRDRYLNTSQKVVQARMWAQGFTIGLVIVAGILSQTSRQEGAKQVIEDHSWASLLDEQERERKIKQNAVLPS